MKIRLTGLVPGLLICLTFAHAENFPADSSTVASAKEGEVNRRTIERRAQDAWGCNMRIDVFFGPKAPQGKETNWVPTDPKGQFELMFRLYGPTPALFDQTWVLPDVEKVK